MAGKPKPLTRVQRSGSGHSYLLDGEPCPGVTTILGNGVPKNGLIGWAAGTVADFVVNRLSTARNDKGEIRIVADDLVRDALAWNAERPDAWQRVKVSNDPLPRLALAQILKNIRYRESGEASANGTEVHGYAARLADGDEVLVPKALEGFVLSYVDFLEAWQPENMIVEGVIVNRRWRYMGTFDIVADFPGVWSGGPLAGEPVGRGLLDIKAGRDVYVETALQVAGYRNGETIVHPDGTEEPMPAVDWCGVLHVRHDGYSLRILDAGPETFRTFLYIRHTVEWLDRDNGPAATAISDAIDPPIIERNPT